MATFRVPNFPELLYERIRKLAEANGRSVEAEVIEILRRMLREDPPRS
jgi:plasmid stability protein